LLFAVILVARAWDNDRADRPTAAPGPVSIAQVGQQLEGRGYRIRKIKEDGGRYKVTVLTPDRHKEKLSISPRSGEIIGRDRDDDN